MSASFVAVLPAIDPTATRACVLSMHDGLRARLLVIDNSADGFGTALAPGGTWMRPPDANIGVPRSWNLGIDWMQNADADWLVILSHSIRFGDAGGRDLFDVLADLTHDAHNPWVVGTQHGWKCIALSRALIERVGRFDTTFGLAYREDTSYLYRMHLAGLPSPRENGGQLGQFNIDATSTGDGRTVLDKLVTIDWDANLRAYVERWGGDQGCETFLTPFNHPALDWTYTGPVPAMKGH